MNFVLCDVCINIYRLYLDVRIIILKIFCLFKIFYNYFNNVKCDVRGKKKI